MWKRSEAGWICVYGMDLDERTELRPTIELSQRLVPIHHGIIIPAELWMNSHNTVLYTSDGARTLY